MADTERPAPGSYGPDSAPIPVTETPSDPAYYFSQFGNELPTSYWDSLKAEVQSTWENLPSQRLGDVIGLRQTDEYSGQKIHPNELNRRFPEVDTPFTEPTSLPVAEEIARAAQHRHELSSIIDRGPQTGVAKFSRWSAGLVTGALDPLSLAAAVATGGLGELTGLTAGVTEAGIGRYAATRFGEGVVGAMAPEAVNAYASGQFHEDYTAGDYVGNILGAGLGYAAISTGLKFGWPKIAEYLRRNPKVEQMTHEQAIAQLLMDRQPDVTPIAREMVKEADGGVRIPEEKISNVRYYHYEPIESSDHARKREFYHGSSDSMGNFRDVPKSPIEENFGQGVYLTDNPVVANAHAARTFSDANGKIFRVGVDKADLNLINLDKTLEKGPVKDVIEKYLDEQTQGSGRRAIKIEEGGATKDILHSIQDAIQTNHLPETALDEIASRLKSAGFDGYVHEGGEFMGEQNAPHNILQLFDPEKTGDAGGLAQETGQFSPDRSLVRPPSIVNYEDLASEKAKPENGINYDPAAAQAFEELVKQPPKEIGLPDLDEKHKEALDELRKLHEQGMLSPEEAKHFERLDELEREAKEEETATKAGLFCMGRDI